MGSVLSKRPPTVASRTSTVSNPSVASPRGRASPPAKPAQAIRVTAELRPKPRTDAQGVYQRPTSDDWAAALNKISGVISSSAWEGTFAPGSVCAGDTHAAQRSAVASGKLPRPRGAVGDVRDGVEEKKGGLSQNQVLALFALRRTDPGAWGAEEAASRFGVEREDVRDLLRFTRTYTGRLDADGRVRAYYKADPEDTIVRFERD